MQAGTVPFVKVERTVKTALTVAPTLAPAEPPPAPEQTELLINHCLTL